MSKARQQSGLSILTLNIHKGFASLRSRLVLERLRDAVRAVRADVVLLQEVLGEHRRFARQHPEWPDQSQYEYLADRIWHHYSYGRNAAYTDGHHGNAVLSKWPIRRERNVDLSVGSHEPRGLLHCELEKPGSDSVWHVMRVHLGLWVRERRVQVARIAEHMRTAVGAREPVVLGGDFNDWSGRQGATLSREAALREAHLEQHGRLARSFPAWCPLLPLDRIYLRNLRVQQVRRLNGPPWRGLSDHLGLIASVQP